MPNGLRRRVKRAWQLTPSAELAKQGNRSYFMRKRIVNFVCPLCLILVFLLAQNRLVAFAQEPEPVPPPPPNPQGVDTGQPVPLMSAAQLDNLVAPIALYPDPLLSQVLVASTYPLEIVEAYQWLQANPGLTGPALTQAAQQQNWDPSVQALVMFPDVLKQLSEDITWTTSLGNAYLAQPQDVMNSVQQLRLQAQQAGQLASTPQQTVTVANAAGQPQVIIEPANPSVIYVPVYDPAFFWGPAVYYPYPRWYYPRRTGLFFGFGPAINVGAFFGGGWGGWGSWGWRPEWYRHHVVVNNVFIESHHFNTARVPRVAGTTVWSHDAFHRHGVPYPAQALTQRYRPNVQQNLRPRMQEPARVAPQARIAPRSAPSPGVFARPAPAPRAVQQPQYRAFSAPREPMGARQVAPNIPSRNRSVFSGIENGRAARSHISRGYSSMGPGRFAAPRGGTPSGGRSRGGGGGGGHHR
jgi:Protein of unknown function (DUF3300)